MVFSSLIHPPCILIDKICNMMYMHIMHSSCYWNWVNVSNLYYVLQLCTDIVQNTTLCFKDIRTVYISNSVLKLIRWRSFQSLIMWQSTQKYYQLLHEASPSLVKLIFTLVFKGVLRNIRILFAIWFCWLYRYRTQTVIVNKTSIHWLLIDK